MKIVITIKDFKVELSDNSDRAIYFSFTDIKELITSTVNDYNKLTNN